jgi:hypothetical protein
VILKKKATKGGETERKINAHNYKKRKLKIKLKIKIKIKITKKKFNSAKLYIFH